MPKPAGGQQIQKDIPIQSAPVPTPIEKVVIEEEAPLSMVPPPTEVHAPKKQVAAFGQFKLKSNFSLTKKKDENASGGGEIEDLTNKPRTPFTLEQLQSKWNSYCYLKNKEGKASLNATLSKNPLTINDDFSINLKIESQIQELELDSHKAELLGVLRKELNNYGIQLNVTIALQESTAKHLTNKDKFIQMAEKNDVLNQLREKLGLDIEY